MKDDTPDASDERDRVLLERGPDWQAVPRGLKVRIESGADRIRQLRRSIARAAKVRYMPPITVSADAWSPDGQVLVHACSGYWRAPGGHALGVLVSVGPTLCEDEALVRAILVHEFSHCFKVATILIDHLDLGASLGLLRGDPLDPRREEALHVRADDWFGPSDAELLRWEDERLPAVTSEVHTLVAAGHLTGTAPPLVEPSAGEVPPEWAEHIRNLRDKPRQS